MTKLTAAASLLITASLAFTGCGPNYQSKSYEEQIDLKAPKIITDELLVMGLNESEVSTLMAKNPHAKVRPLSTDTFEFKGLNKQQVLEVNPEALIEKNTFLKMQASLTKKDLLNRAFDGNVSQEFSPQNCFENTLLRVPEVEILNETGETPEAGNILILRSKKPATSAGLTAWYIMPPNGSSINVQFDDDPELSLKPDMPGSYGVALFYKARNQCNVRFMEVTVTLNEAFDPKLSKSDLSALDSLSRRDFQQIALTNAGRAQELITKKTQIIVAVLDSGVNYNHPALKSNMWVNTKEIMGDGIDNDQNGYIDDIVGFDFENNDGMPMDDVGHGSHVAGLVAGEFMGTGGLSNIKIMALKAGSSKGVDRGSILKGIKYAIDNGADIINMSFGGEEPSELVLRLLEKAHEKGVLVIAASGNGDHTGRGVDNDLIPQYPASYNVPNVLAVGASEKDGSLTRYSNYGQTQVDIVAPGGYQTRAERAANMLSSVYLKNPSNILLQPMSGTSMASPVTAGIAALIMAEKPNLAPGQVKEAIMKTGKKSPALKGQIVSGSVINAEEALLSLNSLF